MPRGGRRMPMVSGGLLEKSQNLMSGAINARSRIEPNRKSETTAAEFAPTAGGAIGAGAGGAIAGAAAGAQIGSGYGGYGAVIGGLVGLAAYYLQ